MTTVIPPADLPSADISGRVDRLADALAEPRVPPSRRPAYVELQASSNFSFLRGASHADELALTAGVLGLQGLAVTDRNSMAGVVRAQYETIDVLINNAGILKTSDVETPAGRDIRFDVNTLAPYNLTKRLLPIMPQTGRVVNLSSAA